MRVLRVSSCHVAVIIGLFAGVVSTHAQCQRDISAKVVAIDQAFYVNRLGALQVSGMIFALRGDVVPADSSKPLAAGNARLRPDKRPRPMVLRANVGDCLTIQFQNLLANVPVYYNNPSLPFSPANVRMGQPPTTPNYFTVLTQQPATRWAGVHIAGAELLEVNGQPGIGSDASWTGANPSSLAAPNQTVTYKYYAAAEGAFLLTSTAANTGLDYAYGGQLSEGLFGSLMVEPTGAEWYRSQVTKAVLDSATTGHTADGHPIVDYSKLAMLNGTEIVSTDLTAIITGPNHGLFTDTTDPTFNPNPSYYERLQPYREFAIHYHDDFMVRQAYPEFRAETQPRPALFAQLSAGRDFFAINYGIGGIGAEVWSNRLGVGPMQNCETCKFEEFFLSSWATGDPAMVVDNPANNGYDPVNEVKSPSHVVATKAFYPDDPSNVYHSYMSDHVKFRILHAGANITHVHHQHAHQWLHSPNSDDSDYRDSQMISPGAAYTLDFTYHGSGNKNLTAGDSIFHCHFYPHFAQGMWSLWRVHDTFEPGTTLTASGTPTADWNRALPDGEIAAGTPTPALVPLPTIAMAPMPARVKICPVGNPKDYVQFSGDTCPFDPKANPTTKITGYKALVSQTDLNAGLNPGYPFFVPGVGGKRAPHPPMDFAVDNGETLDGGLPRHQVLSEMGKPCAGTVVTGCVYEKHNPWDFTKENDSLVAVQLPESGTAVEEKAKQAHATRYHNSFTPDNLPCKFLMTGQPPASGSPFANPAVEDNGHADCNGNDDGTPVTGLRRYKAANIQRDVVLNKKGWHYPQQRFIALWDDVKPLIDTNDKRPEPLFFRANSNEVVEYWHTNLVPDYYELDDFQVRTPTDILGQHIHLVKFDVLASDGAGNGFNYEDGTFSPDDVRKRIGAINKTGGLWSVDATSQQQLTAKFITLFNNHPEWLGAQATVQRWYADPVLNNKGEDRTLRTVFTHDHFGPSTHQQAGLYAGLVVEPANSTWLTSDGQPMGQRDDGGPTSWQAIVVPAAGDQLHKPYREFLLEFQDRQLAYLPDSRPTKVDYHEYAGPPTQLPATRFGWANPAYAINKPFMGNGNTTTTPKLITNQVVEGGFSVNYANEPLQYRVLGPGTPEQTDLAHVFESILRVDPAENIQPVAGTPIGLSKFKFPPPQPGAKQRDPYTPLLRAYEGDSVQIRNLVGAHMMPNGFTVHGLKWQFEPSVTNSGFRSTQGMGISEHYEFLVNLPVTATPEPQSDYLYAPGSGVDGLEGGLWGLLRAYKTKQADLATLPGTTPGQGPPATASCPANLTRRYNVTAAFARDILDGPLFYNSRGIAGFPGQSPVVDWNAMVYVRTDDLVNGKLKPTAPREPLVLRAAAGECIEVTLNNTLPDEGIAMNTGEAAPQFNLTNPSNIQLNSSHEVGLHAQLVSYDVTSSDGVNAGTNPSQTVKPHASTTYRWYAGEIRQNGGSVQQVPIEFGSIALTPADPLMQHPFGMIGSLIIEPAGATWKEDQNSYASATVTGGDGKQFREFVTMVQDDLARLRFADTMDMEAALVNGTPQWVLNGTPQKNNSTIPLVPGSTVVFAVQSGTHGISFMDHTTFDAVFNVVRGIPPTAQTGVGPTAWGTPGESANKNLPTLLLVLQVKPESEIPASITSVPFECTVHKANMAGTFQIQRQNTPNITMEGDVAPGKVFWSRNGVPLPNDSNISVQAGNTITFSVKAGTHGIRFADKVAAQAMFDIEQKVPFIDQPGGWWGTPTTGSPAGTVLAILTVKSNPSVTSVDFQCSVHQTKMEGRFDLGGAGPATPGPSSATPSNWSRAINYRTEPFSYRYQSPNWLGDSGPIGISRVYSDTLVSADPETPVFAAAAGLPVRIRVLHPAGLLEQIYTLHGHVWQEEPYTNDSQQIGNNPNSQYQGARDAFGPNAAFDVVLDSGGGKGKTKGDYLFRTFVATDSSFGMWGLLRVGDPGQDIITITRYEPVDSGRMIVTGRNTVKVDTGEMAKTVTIAYGGATVGTADVDLLSGIWQFEFPGTAPTNVTVTSPLGGTITSGPVNSVVRPAGSTSATSSITQIESFKSLDNDDIVNSFRPSPNKEQPIGKPMTDEYTIPKKPAATPAAPANPAPANPPAAAHQ